MTTAITTASTMTMVAPSPVSAVDESMNGLSTMVDDDDMEDDTAATTLEDPFQHPLLLPTLPISQWPHQSILLQTGVNTHVVALNSNGTVATAESSPQPALPIGIPIDFETSIFRGQFLVRLRNNTSDDPVSHDAYFQNRARILQTVIQGQFKKNIRMSDLFVGTVFRQPMKYAPPPFFMRMMRGLFQRIAPGAILDFASDKPRIVSLYAGAAKSISIDVQGQQPDMTSIDLPESIVHLDTAQQQQELVSAGGKRTRRNRKNTSIMNTDPITWSITDRRRILSNPDTASNYIFDTEHIYTMEVYDEMMDYGNYEIRLPMYGKFNFGEAIGVQPMTFTAVTKQNEILYDFAIWHESVVRRQAAATTVTNTVVTA